MKSTVKNKSVDTPRKYPYIGIVTNKTKSVGCPVGIVVLFTHKETGTCLNPGKSNNPIGLHSHSWIENRFEPLTGEVVLSN